MSTGMDFWFDFSSPYAYLASEQLDALAAAHGRLVRWRPYLLGVVYRQLQSRPVTELPLKGEYFHRDVARSARFLGLPFRPPQPFPVATQQAARAYYLLEAKDEALARRYAHVVFRGYFVDGRNIAEETTVCAIAAEAGADADMLRAALAGDMPRSLLREACKAALQAGVFGSPYVIIDGEPFWGADRLPQIARWLESGGF